jgi:GDPmannose 4,6-dehydratase
MFMIVQNETAGDYVVGSGEDHSIAEFCETAFRCVGLDWRSHVVVDPALVRDVDTPYTRADSAKLVGQLGWKPNMSFESLVGLMVGERLELLRRATQSPVGSAAPASH